MSLTEILNSEYTTNNEEILRDMLNTKNHIIIDDLVQELYNIIISENYEFEEYFDLIINFLVKIDQQYMFIALLRPLLAKENLRWSIENIFNILNNLPEEKTAKKIFFTKLINRGDEYKLEIKKRNEIFKNELLNEPLSINNLEEKIKYFGKTEEIIKFIKKNIIEIIKNQKNDITDLKYFLDFYSISNIRDPDNEGLEIIYENNTLVYNLNSIINYLNFDLGIYTNWLTSYIVNRKIHRYFLNEILSLMRKLYIDEYFNLDLDSYARLSIINSFDEHKKNFYEYLFQNMFDYVEKNNISNYLWYLPTVDLNDSNLVYNSTLIKNFEMLSKYTDDYYLIINKQLRDGKVDYIVKDFYNKLILLFSQTKKINNLVLYRSMNYFVPKIGNVFNDLGFSSKSLLPMGAESFLKDRCCLFMFKFYDMNYPCLGLEHITENPFEYEALTPAGEKFKISNVYDISLISNSTQYIYVCDYINNVYNTGEFEIHDDLEKNKILNHLMNNLKNIIPTLINGKYLLVGPESPELKITDKVYILTEFKDIIEQRGDPIVTTNSVFKDKNKKELSPDLFDLIHLSISWNPENRILLVDIPKTFTKRKTGMILDEIMINPNKKFDNVNVEILY